MLFIFTVLLLLSHFLENVFFKIFSSFNAVFGYFWLLLYAVCICFSSGLDYFHARLGEGNCSSLITSLQNLSDRTISQLRPESLRLLIMPNTELVLACVVIFL